MLNPIMIYGEKISLNFFNELHEEHNMYGKHLTNLKRYFNYLKKNHTDYKNICIKDKISFDKPIIDYIMILNDWLLLETNNVYTIYLNSTNDLYFGFKLNNPINVDDICKLVKDWRKLKDLRLDYHKWISVFEDNHEFNTNEKNTIELFAII